MTDRSIWSQWQVLQRYHTSPSCRLCHQVYEPQRSRRTTRHADAHRHVQSGPKNKLLYCGLQLRQLCTNLKKFHC